MTDTLQHLTDECCSAYTLFEFSEGLLAADEAEDVRRHLAACPSCAAEARRDMELTVSLRDLPLPEPATGLVPAVTRRIRAESRGRRSWPWLVLGLFLVALSTLQWAVWSDPSPAGVAHTLARAFILLPDRLLDALAALTSLETWEHMAGFALPFGQSILSYPVALVVVVLTAVAVVTVANLVLVTGTRLLLEARR